MSASSQAVTLLLKAQKSLARATGSASSGFSSWFSNSTSNYEATGDLFQQTGNQFKVSQSSSTVQAHSSETLANRTLVIVSQLEKRFKEAGDAFKEEAKCRELMGNDARNEAASAWWNAAKAYKQGYPDRA